MKIKALENLPQKMVGDGKKPNLFFVSTKEDGVVTISRRFDIAYDHWTNLAKEHEPILEDRLFGVICDVAPENEDGTGRLIRHDNSHYFLKQHPSTL